MSKTTANQRKASLAWNKRNPLKRREINRKSAEKMRKKEEWKSYFREYMREYHKKNADLQHMQTVPGHIKIGVNKGRKFGYEYQKAYDQLVSVGWSPDTTLHVSHKVPLRLIMKVNKKCSKIICFHPKIIEVVEKVDNHRATRREVTRETWMLAQEMEALFPKDLKGLAKEVKKHIGKML